MGGIGPMQIVIVAVLIVLLFGRGKISALMGDVAKGITSFRKGLKEGSDTPAEPKDVTPTAKLDAEAAASPLKTEDEKTKI